MNVIGAMRVKNEARWIERSIQSIAPLCSRVVVFDDHSTDGTPELCASLAGVEVIRSQFDGTDEARDKNYLLDWIRLEADWVIMIDGDEVLQQGPVLMAAILAARHLCLSLPVWYLWDSEDQMRVDGVYGNFRRQSVFLPGRARFHDRGGANFHCGNVPASLRNSTGYVEAPLLHFGYMHAADRIRKYHWYNEKDPGNDGEDGYKHMVIGDLYGPQCKFRHGGPLELSPVPA